jgi:hypothetical protein
VFERIFRNYSWIENIYAVFANHVKCLSDYLGLDLPFLQPSLGGVESLDDRLH